MKTKKYTQLKENVIEDVLPNGLRVSLVPKNNYHKTFAVITTEYGALDTAFQINNEEPIIIPPGTAHFLEHKLFEKEDGDAFAGFGALGADANAFTNAYQTSYLFSTSQNFSSALSYLLDFVQAPYFTQQTVAKEQGIIGQEIQMYADDPNWKVYMGLLNLMYPDTSLATDIAGTQASIALI
ncbi:MAG: EF-P 5-aminopentanol modification-associated protein YfmH, partial [Leuconostoc fallax]